MKIIYWKRDVEKEDSTIESLNIIRNKWKISFEHKTEFDDDQVYRELFLANRIMLKKRTGKGIRDLKSNKGYVYVNGVITIHSNAEDILYFEKWNKDEFLNKVIDEGQNYIEKTINENVKTSSNDLPEDKLILKFIENAKNYGFLGEFKREYPMVKPIKIESNMDETIKNFVKSFAYVSAKFMDLLHVDPNGTFDVIEAKVKLNWQALGQAVGYTKLFSKLNSIPEEKIRTSIICRQSDGFIEDICNELGIKVIIIED